MSMQRIHVSSGHRLGFLVVAAVVSALFLFGWTPAEAQQGTPTGTETATTTTTPDNGSPTTTRTGTAPTVADTGSGIVSGDSSGAPVIILIAAGALVLASAGAIAASRRS